jgi:hypothetical protein
MSLVSAKIDLRRKLAVEGSNRGVGVGERLGIETGTNFVQAEAELPEGFDLLWDDDNS